MMGSGAIEQASVGGNRCLRGVTSQVINRPPHARVTSDVPDQDPVQQQPRGE